VSVCCLVYTCTVDIMYTFQLMIVFMLESVGIVVVWCTLVLAK